MSREQSDYTNRRDWFESWRGYESFCQVLLGDPRFEEVAVAKPYANVGLSECWFRDKLSGKTWCLVQPDAPFRGVWEMVEDDAAQ